MKFQGRSDRKPLTPLLPQVENLLSYKARGTAQNRPQAGFRIAVAVLPVEFIAVLGLFTFPVDVGYPTGASAWWRAFGYAGILVHYPAFAIPMGADPLSPFVIVIIGYSDLFCLGLVLVLGYRYARKRISSMSPKSPKSANWNRTDIGN